MPASDAEIIARSVEDREAFTGIFDRHYVAISDYLRRRLPESMADEMASETFAIAFRRRADFNRKASSARPWLFGIATNLVHSSRRAERRQWRAYARAHAEQVPDHADEAIERADAQRASAHLATALHALKREERDVLTLWSWAELTYAEIADALDLPIGTVRSRLSRARAHVLELMSEAGQDLSAGDEKGAESAG